MRYGLIPCIKQITLLIYKVRSVAGPANIDATKPPIQFPYTRDSSLVCSGKGKSKGHPCTGCTAHRGSRGIALPFHDRGTRRG